MSDISIPDETDDEAPPVRQLRDAYKRAQADAADAGALRKENAFLKAGVDVDSPVGKLLYKGYDGELEIEAIRAAAQEVNALSGNAPPPAAAAGEPPASGLILPGDDAAQARDRMSLGSETGDPAGTPEPGFESVLEQFHADRERGMDGEQAANKVYAEMMVRAANGDPRFTIDEAAWKQRAKDDSYDLV